MKRDIVAETLKYVPYIGMRAKIDSLANGTPIVYRENGKMVREYPNGTKEDVLAKEVDLGKYK